MNKDKYLSLKRELEQQNVELVAVSKTKPAEDILTAYHWGQRVFGENRARELQQKADELPKDIEWHMIGHLQRNKVKYIAPFVHLIQSVDEPKLLREINKRAKQNNRVINCLLQIHIAEEDSKYGFDEDEIIDLLNENQFSSLEHVNIIGVMGMATFTDNTEQIKREFQHLHTIFKSLQQSVFANKADFTICSMGMSGDYDIAIEQGANMVRIGSLIFGARN